MGAEIQHLIQGGAVGISVALIFLIWKIYDKCSSNTEKVIEVVAKNAEAMTQLTDSIDKNTEMTVQMSSSLNEMNDVARSAMRITKKRKPKK